MISTAPFEKLSSDEHAAWDAVAKHIANLATLPKSKVPVTPEELTNLEQV